MANERLALERRKNQLKKEIANLERIRDMLLPLGLVLGSALYADAIALYRLTIWR